MTDRSGWPSEDELLLAIIHDIRRHLRKSVTHTQMIGREGQAFPLPPEFAMHLGAILSAGKEMDELLSRLAKYAVAGSATQDQSVGDVSILFDSALRRLADKNVDTEIDASPLRRCGIRTPYFIENVLGELLDNALKFRQGPIRISVVVESIRDNHLFGIKDTGIGFDPRFCDRIFRPLERLHPATVYPGCGLGLAISQRILESHGGKLWAESKPGEGSTFWFSVPA